MTVLIDVFLLGLLAITAIAILRVRNLFAVALLAGIYSLLSAGLFTTMDAVDVAFTEAAVGAGISTVLLLGTLVLVGTEESERPEHGTALPLAVVLITGGMLVYGTFDMPPFGAADNPAHQHVAPRYLEQAGDEVGVPNIVTAVLASYRGYDTMGETTVVFAAVVGVLVLLMGRRRDHDEGLESAGTDGAAHGGGAPRSDPGEDAASGSGKEPA